LNCLSACAKEIVDMAGAKNGAKRLECVELAPAFSRLRVAKNAKAPARSLQTAKAHSKRFAPFYPFSVR
jgi:hypothetical protein